MNKITTTLKVIAKMLGEMFNPSKPLNYITTTFNNDIASKEYINDFEWKLFMTFIHSELYLGVYTCGNLTLEITYNRDNIYLPFNCIVFDKNLDIVYDMMYDSNFVTDCRLKVANEKLERARHYLIVKNWVMENNE